MKLYRLLIALAMLGFILNGKQAVAQTSTPPTLDEIVGFEVSDYDLDDTINIKYEQLIADCKVERIGTKVTSVTATTSSTAGNRKCRKLYREVLASAEMIDSGEVDQVASSGRYPSVISQDNLKDSCDICLDRMSKMDNGVIGDCKELCDGVQTTKMFEDGLNFAGFTVGKLSDNSVAKKYIASNENITKDAFNHNRRTPGEIKENMFAIYNGQRGDRIISAQQGNNFPYIVDMMKYQQQNYSTGGAYSGYGMNGNSMYNVYNPSSAMGWMNWAGQFNGNYANTGNGSYNNSGRTGNGVTRIRG